MEDDATPISTPQLTHTSVSTPQLATTHTPSLHFRPTLTERKRYSVYYDSAAFAQSFSASLEAFAEHEPEQTHNEILPSTELVQTSSVTSEPMFTLNHDGTFSQNTVFDSGSMDRYTSHEQLASDDDHFMSNDDRAGDFFAQHNHAFVFSSPASQPQDYNMTAPLGGNWI